MQPHSPQRRLAHYGEQVVGAESVAGARERGCVTGCRVASGYSERDRRLSGIVTAIGDAGCSVETGRSVDRFSVAQRCDGTTGGRAWRRGVRAGGQPFRFRYADSERCSRPGAECIGGSDHVFDSGWFHVRSRGSAVCEWWRFGRGGRGGRAVGSPLHLTSCGKCPRNRQDQLVREFTAVIALNPGPEQLGCACRKQVRPCNLSALARFDAASADTFGLR